MVEFNGNRLETLPEVLTARRVVELYNLKFPYNLRQFAEKIVRVIYLNIPIGNVDGVVLNLKTPGKEAKILINSSIPSTRQRFTLAHELGHYFIPWHIGVLGESVHADYNADSEYAEMEMEANRFAAELLMPTEWVKGLFNTYNSLADIHKSIIFKADVSALAAAYKILDVLPPDYIFVETDEYGVITKVKSSFGSVVRLPNLGGYLNDALFHSKESHSEFKSKNVIYHWLGIKREISIADNIDNRDWREVLNDIISESDIPVSNHKSAIQSTNGIIGSLYGNFKREKMCTAERFKAACLARFSNRKDCLWLSQHNDFELFLDKRIRQLFKI